LFRTTWLVFGNESEIVTLSKKIGLVDVSVSADYGDACTRTVACTLDALSAVACESGEDLITSLVSPITREAIVDTNGDSFLGGFLQSFVKGTNLGKCIGAGSYAASTNLRMRGCSVHAESPTVRSHRH
jgi:sugar/nucleoside kinase (ribokinase family)